ncbi:hypothetical protein CC117_00165 [Parafrankia colletiae]|uniref:Luciferase-like domain-containing protein n=1 Tax=Parafrankia colletiae TaxID=573497 RepID=A0A1S1RIU6_9ACTN|nr:hypothetical protein CC117_00165 [Parafrankia colletiae]
MTGRGPLPASATGLEQAPLDPVEVDAESARRYADLGVDRLLVYPLPLESESGVAAFLERHASLIR